MFDLVDHNVLCTKLRNLGVHNVLITWIGSFLTNRSQSVKISSPISGHVVPRTGIPQGTKLAPLLFAVLVNTPGQRAPEIGIELSSDMAPKRKLPGEDWYLAFSTI